MSERFSAAGGPHVAVIGAGVAGSTAALRLAELGVQVTLLEQGSDVVNGPPFCHLHAGGNLYPEISDQQCIALLEQSVDTASVYRHGVNRRPTVIAIPESDSRSPDGALARLQRLRDEYRRLVDDFPDRAALGHPDDYFRCYSRADLHALARRPLPSAIRHPDDWMVPIARQLTYTLLKFPVFLVQEYGLSAARVAAITKLALSRLRSCRMLFGHSVVGIEGNDHPRWSLQVIDGASGERKTLSVDYLVNACGFRSGTIDDMLGLTPQRWLEFKAAYLARWPQRKGLWPELAIHGERGTPQGMVQLTPYGEGLCQLHGMSEGITLFDGGLVRESATSAQPQLPPHLLRKLQHQWPSEEVSERTKAAIASVSQYIPAFVQASVGGPPMYGAQQIPGRDPALRVADVSFAAARYARVEIIKASSALASSDAIVNDLIHRDMLPTVMADLPWRQRMSVVQRVSPAEVDALAECLARQRHYPAGLLHQVDGVEATPFSLLQ